MQGKILSTAELLTPLPAKPKLSKDTYAKGARLRSDSLPQLGVVTDYLSKYQSSIGLGRANQVNMLSLMSKTQKLKEMASARASPTQKKSFFKVVKLYVTMDEAMDQGAKRTRDSLIEPETKLKEEDPLRILLYDLNVHNRKRAARIITRKIEVEIRGLRNGVKDESIEDFEASDDDSVEDREVLPQLSMKEMKEKLAGCNSLREKLNKIDHLRSEYFDMLTRSNIRKVSTSEENLRDLGRSAEESLLKHNKSTERFKRIESRTSIDLQELFNNTNKQRAIRFNTRLAPHEFVGSLLVHGVKGLKEIVNKLVEGDLTQFFSNVTAKIQANKERSDNPGVNLNFTLMNVPNCELNKVEGLYMCTRFAHFGILRNINLTGNPIGDIVGHCMVKVLARYADNLESLNLTNTKAGQRTAEALVDLLIKPEVKLRVLGLSLNKIDDRGIEVLVEPLIFNTSLEILCLSRNPLSKLGALLLARIVRGNKSIKSLRLNGLDLSGRPIHDISRALIINKSLKDLSLNNSGLQDSDIKELCFSLSVNRSLSLLSLVSNSLTKEALKILSQLMTRNSTLLHIGLSGNIEIRIEHLDQLKLSLPKTRDLEIVKQEDLPTLQLSRHKGLDVMVFPNALDIESGPCN